jgi:hypothetical protein
MEGSHWAMAFPKFRLYEIHGAFVAIVSIIATHVQPKRILAQLLLKDVRVVEHEDQLCVVPMTEDDVGPKPTDIVR